MNYAQMVTEALAFLSELAAARTKRAKSALLEDRQENEIADEMLDMIKDEAVHFDGFPALKEAKTETNRLENYLRFTKLASRLKEDPKAVNENVLLYIFRQFDEEEQRIYRAILEGDIQLPAKKAVKKEVVEEAVEVETAPAEEEIMQVFEEETE